MRAAVALAVVAALLAGTTAAGDAGSRTVRLPKIVGLARSDAEARLTDAGLRYLLPTPRAQRFEPLAPAAGLVERAVPEENVPDRVVVAQEPKWGRQRVGRGDFIPFGTVVPEGAAAADDAYVFSTRVRRIAVAEDGRRITLGFRALARRCQALDHVDVGYAARYVTVFPSVTGTARSEQRCRDGSKRAAQVDLSEDVGDRVILDSIPTRPKHGLRRVRAAPFTHARGQSSARAVALYFGHSSDCGLLAGYRVRETKRLVRITLRTGNSHGGRFCLANLIEDVTVVPLRRPLGDRRIVDGGDG
jgi:hypothetical protein